MGFFANFQTYKNKIVHNITINICRICSGLGFSFFFFFSVKILVLCALSLARGLSILLDLLKNEHMALFYVCFLSC